jgi:hypothetical protein
MTTSADDTSLAVLDIGAIVVYFIVILFAGIYVSFLYVTCEELANIC